MVKCGFEKGKYLKENNWSWKGGRNKDLAGYIRSYAPDHPRQYQKYVYEHILIIENKLGRYLEKGEIVHHINGIKDDNRPENLIVCKNHQEHNANHRDYEWFDKSNIPIPTLNILGKKIRVNGNKKHSYKKCSLCVRCKKVFWRDMDSGIKNKGYCSNKCGILMGKWHK